LPITALAIDINSDKQFSIVAGDQGGVITAFLPHSQPIYKVRITDDYLVNSMLTFNDRTTDLCIPRDPKIYSLLSVLIKDSFGICTNFLLVADGTNILQYYNQGRRVFSLEVPSKINTMCCGYFSRIDEIQIALGCDNGFIYILNSYAIEQNIKVGNAITKLTTMKMENLEYNILLCIGHFNELKIYYSNELIATKKTSDWIHTLSLGDLSNIGTNEIVLGLLNNTVIILQLSFK